MVTASYLEPAVQDRLLPSAVKCGEKGVIVYKGGNIRSIFEKRKFIDEIGAGDSFEAGFLRDI